MKAVRADFSKENSLANVLRILRIAEDLTISELSERASLTSSYICDVESGKRRPSLDTLKKFAEGLQIPYSTICVFDEEQSQYGYSYRKLLLKVLQMIDTLEKKRLQLVDDSDSYNPNCL